MTQDKETVVVEGDVEDRISVLPRDVIDRILDRLPIKDAAKTCILAKNWRYIWAELPRLELDYEFCQELIEESESKFREVVDKILLMHVGKILKFDLDVCVEDLASYKAVDRWLLYVTRNSVKKLSLRISDIGSPTYKLPPCIFNCPTLTHLKLARCSFKPPCSFLGFPNLVTLQMASVTFSKVCVIKAPLLANLTLNCCGGIQYLNIVSPMLKTMYVRYRDNYIALNCFMNSNNLKELGLYVHEDVDNPNHDQRSTLENLLVSLPSLEVLQLDSSFIELLSTGVVPSGLPFKLKGICKLSLYVDFGKLDQVFCVLQLVKSSPNLSKLQISVCGTGDNFDAFLECMQTCGCLKQPFDKLKYVTFYGFGSSKHEMLFAVILLSCAPSLLRMCIKKDAFGPWPDLISEELAQYPIASPNVEIVVI